MEPDSAKNIVQTTLEKFGRVDILVNNAGQSMAKAFEDVSHDDWEYDFELKVWGAVRLIQESIPEMRKVGGGRIINVTNLGGRTPGPASCPPPSPAPPVSPSPRACPRTWPPTTFWSRPSASA